jgi:hypothetical protein
MPITSQEYKEATARMMAMRATTPAAIAAYYDRKTKKIVVNLSTGHRHLLLPAERSGARRCDALPTQRHRNKLVRLWSPLPAARRRSLRARAPRRHSRLAEVDGGPARRRGRQSPLTRQAHCGPRQRSPRRPSPQVRRPLTRSIPHPATIEPSRAWGARDFMPASMAPAHPKGKRGNGSCSMSPIRFSHQPGAHRIPVDVLKPEHGCRRSAAGCQSKAVQNEPISVSN